MRLEEARAILRLGHDADLDQAEEAFVTRQAAIQGELDQLSEKSSLAAALRAELDKLDTAIALLRDPPDPDATVIAEAVSLDDTPTEVMPAVEAYYDRDATIVNTEPDAGDSRPAPAADPDPDPDATVVVEPADPDITLIGSHVDSRPQPEVPAIEPEKKVPLSWLLGGGGALLAVLLAVFLMLPGEDEPSQPAAPATALQPRAKVSDLPESVQMRVLGARWLTAIDQLQQARDRLMQALMNAGEDDQGRAFREQVINEDELAALTRTLRTPFPGAQGLEATNAAFADLTEQLQDARQRVSRMEALATMSEAQEDSAPPPPAETAPKEIAPGETAPEETEAPVSPGAGTPDIPVYQERGTDTAPPPATEPETSDATATATATATAADIEGEPEAVDLALEPAGESPSAEQQEAEALFTAGMEAVSRERLTRPEGESALDYLHAINEVDPDSPRGPELREAIEQRFLRVINRAVAERQPDWADTLIRRAVQVLGGSAGLRAAGDRVVALREQLAEQRLQPGQVVEEVSGFPMVVLPTGSFTMGTPEDNNALRSLFAGIGGLFGNLMAGPGKRYEPASEQPSHVVNITRPIAFARSEVTVGQFRRFVEATDYVTDAERRGEVDILFGDRDTTIGGRNWRHDYLGLPAQDNAPVIHVSYNDADAFARWLSKQAGARYRLPSESEFEYAAQAGTGSIYPWGDGNPPGGYDNFRGDGDEPTTGWQSLGRRSGVREVRNYSDGYFGPAPSDSFQANPFGLKNLMGNVSEWTADCYLPDYSDKDDSQQARDLEACEERVIRGNAWGTDARFLRASWRLGQPPEIGSNTVGFRLVREIELPDS